MGRNSFFLLFFQISIAKFFLILSNILEVATESGIAREVMACGGVVYSELFLNEQNQLQSS